MGSFDYNYLINAVFTAIFAVFGMYHLISFVILKHKILLYYSVFILGLTLHRSPYLLAKSGWSMDVSVAEGVDKASLLTAMITIFGLLMYTKDYLNITKRGKPFLWRTFAVCIAVVVCLPVVHLLNMVTLGNEWFNDFLVMFAAIMAMVAIILNVFSGYHVSNDQKTNRYYLFSYIPILLSALIYIGTWFLQQSYDFDASAMVFTALLLVTLQLILFSIIISLKFKAIEDDHLNIQVEANEVLAAEVERQTCKLHLANKKLGEQNKELERINQLKNRLFSLLTHDVRGPLTNITALVALMEDEVNNSELKLMTQKLNNQIHDRVSMVNALLEWSYHQLEGITVTKNCCAVEEVFRSVANEFEHTAAEKKIQIQLVVAWPQLHVDQDMFKAMLRNLLSNALKFSTSGKTVILSSQPRGHHIDIAVQDFGVGMNADWYHQLKADGTPRTSKGTNGEKGTGFGLLITKDFVEMNGGELICTSEMGKGTTFVMRYPHTAHPNTVA